MQLPIADGATDDFVMLDFDHEVTNVTWMFERIDEPTTGMAPISLDIGSSDGSWADVADRAEALGAERLAERQENAVRWTELRDPDGNRFRVFAARPGT